MQKQDSNKNNNVRRTNTNSRTNTTGRTGTTSRQGTTGRTGTTSRQGTTGRTGTANRQGATSHTGTTSRASGTRRTSDASSRTTAKMRAETVKNRQRARQARRKAAIRKRVRVLIIVAILAVAAFFVVNAIMNAVRVMNQESAARENRTQAEIAITDSDILHLSFPQLSVTEGEGRITVDEFKGILEDLYQKGYMLIDIYSIAGVTEDGSLTVSDLSEFPEGKIPLVISERNVSYSFDRIGSGGYAKKLVQDGDGNIKCEYDQQYGSGTLTGDYDVVPVLESFILEHPDFSFEGARGVLGLTGYNGILGYRTAEYLADFEGNPFAETYGLFDTAIEKEGAAAMADALKERGWRFALNGYGYYSYGSEYSMVESDLNTWMMEVSPLIGGADLCIFPYDTDIGSWQPYGSDNAKFNLLKEKGFKYFFIKSDTDSLLQIRSDYVREGIFEINSADDYTQLMDRKYDQKGTAE